MLNKTIIKFELLRQTCPFAFENMLYKNIVKELWGKRVATPGTRSGVNVINVCIFVSQPQFLFSIFSFLRPYKYRFHKIMAKMVVKQFHKCLSQLIKSECIDENPFDLNYGGNFFSSGVNVISTH